MFIKSIIIILFFIGSILITIDLTKMNIKCPSRKTVHKYIPKTIDQDNPLDIDKNFGSMFEKPSLWARSFTNPDSIHKEKTS